jgi:hypothetical protein
MTQDLPKVLADAGTWTAPVPTVRGSRFLLADERPSLVGYLDWHRYTLSNICAGLTAEQLVLHAVPSSDLSLLGLVRHMTKVERIWFRERVNSEVLEPMFNPALGWDADFLDLDPRRAAEDFQRYEAECRLASQIAERYPLECLSVMRNGEPISLRMIYLHVIGEYSRHSGHADLLREMIDGVTGR